MKKIFRSIALASVVTLGSANAGGVPTFDGVNIGINMSDLTQSLMQTFKLIQQYDKQIKQFAKQKDQYENQFGNLSGVISELENLEFIKTADGYIPANWNEAAQLLQGVSNNNVPNEIKSNINKVLGKFSEIDIQDTFIKNKMIKENKALANELQLYLTQMKVAQDRLRSTQQLSDKLADVETQKERQVINAQINVENLKAQSEIATILSSNNAKRVERELKEQQARKHYQESLEKFIKGK